MASVASQLIEEAATHAQRDSLEDAREICADRTYFPNNLHIIHVNNVGIRIHTFCFVLQSSCYGVDCKQLLNNIYSHI